MEEIVKLVTTSLGAAVLFSIIGIVLNWLFIRSAIKSGTTAAIKYILDEYGFLNEREEINKQKILEQYQQEMESWNQ